MAAAPNFQILSEEELQQLLDGTDAPSTKRSIKFGFSKLQEFALIQNINLADRTIPELDHLLCSFYASLRKSDGTLYTKISLQAIRYGVQRHYLHQHDMDNCSKVQFPKSVKMFKAVMIKLKHEGKGVVNHKSVISSQDMEKIATSCDTNDPAGLQNKVFMDVMIYFCNRGRENLRFMTAEDFSLKTDEDGLRYITKCDQLTKNNREDQNESSNMGVMYEVPGCERCLFLKYKSKLNPMCSCFWQKPKQKMPENGNDPWYCNAPLGVNTLGNKTKDISIKSGCSKIYTNHCLRATCITTLDTAGFHSCDIMTVSGHHSEQSIKNYSKTSDKRKKEMSTMLGQKLNEAGTEETQSKKGKAQPLTLQMVQSRDSMDSTAVSTMPGPSKGSDLELDLDLDLPADLTRRAPTSVSLSQEEHLHQDFSSKQQIFNFHGCNVNIYNKT
ncbi:uncharacterized protein [Diadema antillarum]|uniref:uncharacterized protein n=1 Tax=Diadema antillarum TaxID=105358 RepID=UPI003A84F34B